jgi:hypothetical protein
LKSGRGDNENPGEVIDLRGCVAPERMRLPIAALWLSDELRRLWQSSRQRRFDHAKSFSILEIAYFTPLDDGNGGGILSRLYFTMLRLVTRTAAIPTSDQKIMPAPILSL